jgi:hypothetical protein
MLESFQFEARRAPSKQRLPHPRRISGKLLPRPRKRNAGKRWAFHGATLLEEAHSHSPEEAVSSERKTKAGLTEVELLHALNYLDEDGLQAFPGIGGFLANKIREHRKLVDYYQNLEELLQVPLFGAKRFEKLVGRPPAQSKLTVRQIMRFETEQSQPLTLRQFQPWLRPAPGIGAIWLIPAQDYHRKKESFANFPNVVVESVGSYRLVFLCEEAELKGRSKYLIRHLPKLIRSINYERSFTTADK